MPPGRPLNTAYSDAARKAALDILDEQGYAALSMEAVAQRTGIAKQTLYRRWKHKRALLLDAFAETDLLPPLPDTGTLEGDLRGFLHATFAILRSECGPTNRALIAEGLQDPDFMTELRERHLSKRRRQLFQLFQRAWERGTMPTIPNDFLLDLALGPIWYRLILQNAPLDDSTADALAAAIAALAQRTS